MTNVLKHLNKMILIKYKKYMIKYKIKILLKKIVFKIYNLLIFKK